jgi:hypothetical protein
MNRMPDNYPNLLHFFSCYFYQECESEFGGIDKALDSYCAETGIDHRRATAREIRSLLSSGIFLAEAVGALGAPNLKVNDLAEWMSYVAKRIEE